MLYKHTISKFYCNLQVHIVRFITYTSINDCVVLCSRVNADLNDLPWELTVDKFPTIVLFPAHRSVSLTVY